METKEKKEKCGIVMPISSIDDCDERHWAEVQEIITEAIESAGFEGNIVSNSDDVGIIHKRIIQNLYDNPIVVCDVSGKNPNVMFELGMRLAFDKPTIIVKDNKTSYSFDTSAIEHLEYPRDLRFSQIVEFKEQLTEKIRATYKKSKEDPSYTTFLKHFGTFHVAKIESREVSEDQLILEEIKELRNSISSIRNKESSRRNRNYDFDPELITITTDEIKKYAKQNGLRGKVQIRECRDEIQDLIQRVIDAPKHFDQKRDFVRFFDAVFLSLYG